MTISKKQLKNIAKELGSRGGKANFKKHGKEHMSKIGQIGIKSRKVNEAKNM